MGRPGGPQLGSGTAPAEERDWVRSKGIRTTFRPGEYQDLRAIAAAWGVPVATALWAIVHERLAKWRKKPVELGEHGLAITAGLAVTRRTSERGGGDADACSL